MEAEELKNEILALKEEREAVILAHNYQRPEIQDIADYLGDSLDLSRIAARTEAKVIVFCGVRFMAETAAIFSPDKTVLLPVKEAGCPLADTVTVEQLRKKKEEHPEAVVVSYVNTSAAVKAESDVCCTSANAVAVVSSIEEKRPILFVPDMNLGRYAAQVSNRQVILWEGSCPSHISLYADDVRKAQRKHPEAKFMAHPECFPEVLELADRVAGTSGMLSYVGQSEAQEFIVGTETGLIYRLQKEYPGKRFYPATEHLVCPTMKMTSLERVFQALQKMQYVITLPEKVQRKARKALDAMLSLG
ncbi:MAG: quinolinate synthase [Candidatus Latescibacterota bacterium]|nr:MAG: quinolinate synthase [Candidatus Latescibacterota bacterium]